MNTNLLANDYVKKVNPMYAPRLSTDALFEAEAGSFNYTGIYDEAIRFVEDHQSLNVELWELFVEQFRSTTDANGGWRGEYWGKMMRGACWVYKYTQNPKLYETLKNAVLDLISTQDELGRIAAYTLENEFTSWDMWCRKYVLLGFQYFYDICPEEDLKKQIVEVMRKHLDYIMSKVGEEEGKIGILDTSVNWGALNSSSILEPVVRFYNLTGEEKYLAFAKYILEAGGSSWGNVFELALEGEKYPYEYPVTKAYEEMSYFEGMLEYYRITGDDRCKKAFFNFLDKAYESDITIIGSAGCTHELFDNSAFMQTEESELIMQETCVTVTFMKICYQALCISGNPKYASWIEKAAYNAMLGSINFERNIRVAYPGYVSERNADEFFKRIGGFTFDSYAPLYKQSRARQTGGYQPIENGTKAYGCCACIGAAGVALPLISSVMLSKGGFAINQYMNGEFKGTTPTGQNITIKTETGYPFDGKVKFAIALDRDEVLDIKLRVPPYCNDGIIVDGVRVASQPDTYYSFCKEWKNGDRFDVEFDIQTEVMMLNGRIAVKRGCVVYGVDSRIQNIDVLVGDKIVKEEVLEKEINCRDERAFTFDNGAVVKMVDYASAGNKWDDRSIVVTAWMDKKTIAKEFTDKINPMYAPRLKTDKTFEAAPGSFDYTGVYNDAVRFVEGHQSLNSELWVLFVEQFRSSADAKGGWRGEYWGKMMRGACWIYKYTNNPKLYEVLKASVLDLMTTQDELGRISAYEVEGEFTSWDMWCRKYVLLGMQYFYDICPEEDLKAKIVEVMQKHLDYIMSKVGPEDDKLDILQTTTESNWTWGGLNSSSILEPVVRLYSLTKKQEYLDYAKYILEAGGSSWGNVFELALNGSKYPYEYPVTKAYEMMSYFEGALEYYRVTGDERCKTAVINFFNKLRRSDITIIGSAGCTHELFDNSAVKQTEYSEQIMQETCVTVTYMKLCYQLLCLTGGAKYARYMEQAGYNAMLGSINFEGNKIVGEPDNEKLRSSDEFIAKLGGFTFDSYSPLYKSKRNRAIGGFQYMDNKTKSYGCCVCIGGAGVALMPLSSVMIVRGGFAINQYMNGTFTSVTPGGQSVKLKMETGYPFDGKIKITVELEKPEMFKLKVRVPYFCKNGILVDGKRVNVAADNYYMDIREWKNGDGFEVEFDMIAEVKVLNGKASVTRGCVVYAIDSRIQDVDVKVSDKIVSDEPIEKEFNCRDARLITFDNGSKVKMVDYASAGNKWDDRAIVVTAWMDM